MRPLGVRFHVIARASDKACVQGVIGGVATPRRSDEGFPHRILESGGSLATPKVYLVHPHGPGRPAADGQPTAQEPHSTCHEVANTPCYGGRVGSTASHLEIVWFARAPWRFAHVQYHTRTRRTAADLHELP